MNRFLILSLIIFLHFHFCFCLNFGSIEICASYVNYSSQIAHYGEKGVASPENFYSSRSHAASVYSEARNKFYLFGGYGYGSDGILVFQKLLIFKDFKDF